MTNEREIVSYGDAEDRDYVVAYADTGEIIDGPLVGLDHLARVELLHGRYLEAKDQRDEWDAARATYNVILARELRLAGVGKHSGDFGSATLVAEYAVETAHADTARSLVLTEVLTEAQLMDMLANCAKTLDVGKVREWLSFNVEDGRLRETIGLYIIERSPRGGHALAKPPREQAPKRSSRKVQPEIIDAPNVTPIR